MDYSYDYYVFSYPFSSLTHEGLFSGCCSALIKRESRFIVALLFEDFGAQCERTFGERRQKYCITVVLSTNTGALCPLRIAISWRVQVRKCACGTILFAPTGTYMTPFVVIDKWTKPVDETKLIPDPALLPSVAFFDTVHLSYMIPAFGGKK